MSGHVQEHGIDGPSEVTRAKRIWSYTDSAPVLDPFVSRGALERWRDQSPRQNPLLRSATTA
jgi:hypothetical protein